MCIHAYVCWHLLEDSTVLCCNTRHSHAWQAYKWHTKLWHTHDVMTRTQLWHIHKIVIKYTPRPSSIRWSRVRGLRGLRERRDGRCDRRCDGWKLSCVVAGTGSGEEGRRPGGRRHAQVINEDWVEDVEGAGQYHNGDRRDRGARGGDRLNEWDVNDCLC